MIQINQDDLLLQKSNFDVVNKVALQIQKDFQLYDEKINLSGASETAYDELFEQVKPIIFRMLELDASRFFSLLYAIDMDERKVKTILFGKKESDVAVEITHLILERELLKVISRQIFSQQINI